MAAYIITAVVVLIYLVLVWFVGSWMQLHGAGLWALRGLLALIGLAGAGAFVWFYRKNRSSIGADAGGSAAGEIDQRLREALTRLRAIARDRRRNFGDYPLVLVLGTPGTTKTSILRNCGLDADLLSGQVEQDGSVVPTSTANLFLARQTVFVDIGGSLLDIPGGVRRVLARLEPNNFSRAMRSGQAAPRSVVVCVDCESLQDGSQAGAAVARKLNAALQETAQVLGTDFAVYVVFTKLDRVTGFNEFLRNFSKDEASQVLGATLPLRGRGVGVYAEEESKRLTARFDELFCSLAEKRTEVLARETDAVKSGAAYEFPRELRKLRTVMVQILVDICRPTQMPNNPFLRGFYFCGVRPLIIEEMAHAAVERPAAADAGPRGATRMFNYSDMAAATKSAMEPASTVRKVPQWAFAGHLFADVILRDRTAMAVAGVSSNVSVIRRMLLAAAAAAGCLLIAFFTISFFANRSMQQAVSDAAQALPATQSSGVPSISDLQNLDALRGELATIGRYRRDGAPWYMRWGLYSGGAVYPEARRIYFSRFRALLFGATQARLASDLRALPATPDSLHEYGNVYDTLKAYLITTSHPEKVGENANEQFLSRVLYERYAAGREIDEQREHLIRTQFDFYSAELAAGNPYGDVADSAAVAQGRAYLKNFADVDRYYRSIISQASASAPAVNFNRKFPGSAEVLINNRDVTGAFTKDGYTYVQDKLRNLEKSLMSEDWVLGAEGSSVADVAKLRSELATRYDTDFVAAWHAFLKGSEFRRYQSVPDAIAKLSRLSGPTSPMLELFSTASCNTAVSGKDVASLFQPVQAVASPDCTGNQFIQPANQAYATALSNLQSQMTVVQNSPGGLSDAGAVQQAITAATAGQTAVAQMAQAFRVDAEGHVESVARQLLNQPFEAAIVLLRGASARGVNDAAAAFCASYDRLMQKFPMKANAREEATLDEFNALFAPGKQFWQMYDANLSKVLLPQGSVYAASSTGSLHITPDFQRFFNHVAELSNALYPGGSPQPRVTYTLTQSPQNNVGGLSITIDSETLTGNGARKQFAWPGTGQGLRLTSAAGLLASFEGVWAPFHFFSTAHWSTLGGKTTLEYPFGAVPGQTPLVPRYELEDARGIILLRQLAGTRCVRVAAR